MNRRKIVLLCLAVLAFNACVLFSSGGLTSGGTTEPGLSGTLVDDQGAPISSAVVKAYAVVATDTLKVVTTASDSLSDTALDSTTTGLNGRFKFDHLKNGDYNLVGKYHKGDSTRIVSHREVHYTGSTDVGRDTVKAPGIILISARWQNLPLRGVRCLVIGASAAAVSDDSGRCLLANVAPGVFQIRMMKEGFYPVVTGDMTVRSDKITYATPVTLVAQPIASSCWNLRQSNGYYGILFLRDQGNRQFWDSLAWRATSTGQLTGSGTGTGIDSISRISFDQHFPGNPIIGYYSADVRGDSLLNGITKSNHGDYATWFAARTPCPE